LIPVGKVATYGQIALLCERPQHARQVGLGLNRKISEPLPAHRVVNHQGYLTGASAFEQPDMHRYLLEAEGVTVTYRASIPHYRVDLKQYQWQPDQAIIQAIGLRFRERHI
jgi:methylated-DNA-protein-cysteine methyltransferase-like protein